MLKSYETNSLAKLQINYFDNSQAGLYCLIALYFTILKSYVQTCDLVSNILFLFACFGNKSKRFFCPEIIVRKKCLWLFVFYHTPYTRFYSSSDCVTVPPLNHLFEKCPFFVSTRLLFYCDLL